MSSGRLAGSVSGGTQDKAQYVPDIYTQAQNQWIDAFYKQNGYFGELYFLLDAALKREVNVKLI